MNRMSNQPTTPEAAADFAEHSGQARRPAWAGAVGKVAYALVVHRARLRRAARQAGDPATSKRLRRLAQRRRGDVKELVRSAPADTITPKVVKPEDVVPHSRRQLALANEISSLAATLRSNRKVRVAVDRAQAHNPPATLAAKLTRIASDLEIEAGDLNRRLRDISVMDIDVAGSPATET